MGENSYSKSGRNLFKISIIIICISFWVGSFSFIPFPILLDKNYQYNEYLTMAQYRIIRQYYNAIISVSVILFGISLLIDIIGVFLSRKELSRDPGNRTAKYAWKAGIIYFSIVVFLFPFVLSIFQYIFHSLFLPLQLIPPA